MTTPAMQNSPVLADLHDIALPPPISWWPPAPGWWLVLMAGVLVLGMGLWYWRKTRLRRAALQEWRRIQQQASQLDQRQLLSQLAHLLRRYALAKFPASTVAGLQGDHWLTFLDQQAGFTQFTQGPGRVLAEQLYQPLHQQPPVDKKAVLLVVKRWIQSV